MLTSTLNCVYTIALQVLYDTTHTFLPNTDTGESEADQKHRDRLWFGNGLVSTF